MNIKKWFQGRLNRKKFFLGHLLILLPSGVFLLLFLISTVIDTIFFEGAGTVPQNGSTVGQSCVIDGIPTLLCLENVFSVGLTLIFIVSAIISLTVGISVYFRRLHDLNYSGWLLPIFICIVSFALFINLAISFIASLLFYLWLQFSPGTQGKNKYGGEEQ